MEVDLSSKVVLPIMVSVFNHLMSEGHLDSIETGIALMSLGHALLEEQGVDKVDSLGAAKQFGEHFVQIVEKQLK